MNAETYLNIGSDFRDEHGTRWTTVQLVRQSDGKAIAIADYKDGKRTRTAMLPEVNAGQFLVQAGNLVENSIPITFTHHPLPL